VDCKTLPSLPTFSVVIPTAQGPKTLTLKPEDYILKVSPQHTRTHRPGLSTTN
jgi:hypothetical protein